MEDFFEKVMIGFTLLIFLGMFLFWVYSLLHYTIPALVFTFAIFGMWLIGHLAEKYL